MEFGRVPDSMLAAVDFSLPQEPVWNKNILPGKTALKRKLYVGCAKWDRPEWLGIIYPPKTRARNFLDHYVQQFNSVELNATHYKIIGPAGIARWKMKAAGKDFLFCPKMYKGITHKGKLKEKRFLTNEYLRGIAAFEENLGPVFVQMNETFSPRRKDELIVFLQSLPTNMQFFLEVRHPGWFAKESIMNELLESLRSINTGIVITDAAGRRDCVHMHLSVPRSFIRFVGNCLHPSDYKRIDEWVERIGYLFDNGLEELYFFMHMHDEATTPDLTIYLVEKLNAALGAGLIRPGLQSNQPIAPKRRKGQLNK